MAKTTKPEQAMPEAETKPQASEEQLLSVLSGITKTLDNLSSRLDRIETGGKNEFRKHQDIKDIEAAATGREGVDPRLVKIVDELLGEDFGIRLESHKDGRLGFLFTIVVPKRLSDLPTSERPVKGEDGKYKQNPDGTTLMETYQPEDLRSRAITSTGNVDDIKEHCERVRSHIVAYYTKLSRPIPEFKIK